MEYKRPKMPIERRAKIFLPFAGVRGLDEALEKKRRERLMEDKIILSEDGEAEINEALTDINKGDMISLSYYDGGRYQRFEGKVLKKDVYDSSLILENGVIVYFKDIHSIMRING